MSRRSPPAKTPSSRATDPAAPPSSQTGLLDGVNPSWIAFRPRRHPVLLASVVALVGLWVAFLLWMVANTR